MQTAGKSKRQYSDEEKALALVALDFNGGNLHRTARELTIPRKTLAAWAAGRNHHPEVAKKRRFESDQLADRLEEIIRDALDAITPEKMQQAGLLQLARAVGLFVDKVVLLRGCRCRASQCRQWVRHQ